MSRHRDMRNISNTAQDDVYEENEGYYDDEYYGGDDYYGEGDEYGYDDGYNDDYDDGYDDYDSTPQTKAKNTQVKSNLTNNTLQTTQKAVNQAPVKVKDEYAKVSRPLNTFVDSSYKAPLVNTSTPQAPDERISSELGENKMEGNTLVNGVRITPNSSSFLKKKTQLVEAHIGSQGDKSGLNMVVVGHVDSGKSTLIGHMLVKSGRVTQRNMKKLETEAASIGKGSFSLAWVLDEHTEERQRGVTVDVGHNWFETTNRTITVLDCPGHRDFVPNMITGASQADVGILVVSAQQGEFEAGFEGGQTREHAVLLHSLGVRQIVVAINKLDSVLPLYDIDRYDQIKARVEGYLQTLGYDTATEIRFCPVSGFKGTNIDSTSKVQELSLWYDGPCLFDMINTFAIPPRSVDKPARLVINDVSHNQFLGLVVGGKLDSGAIVTKERMVLAPSMLPVTVHNVEVCGVNKGVSVAGDNVSVSLKDIDESHLFSGMVLCDIEHPVPLVTSFRAQIVANQTRNQLPILPGSQLILHTQGSSYPCTVTKIVSLLAADGSAVTKKPRMIPSGSNAVVDISVKTKLCMEKYSDYRELGRITLRRNADTIAVGIVTELDV